jgi:hypothetical protein
MRLTDKQKHCIRAWWRDRDLRFRADGAVLARKGGAWGTLYTPEQTVAHLRAVGLA